MFCASANTRLRLHAALDLLTLYCSPDQGFFVIKPPEQVPAGLPMRRPDLGPENHTGGPWPVDPGPSEPTLFGAYRVCPKMDHPSCTHARFEDIEEPTAGPVVFAPGHHGRGFAVDRPVELLAEPGAWLGSLWPQWGGIGIALRPGADGTVVAGDVIAIRYEGPQRGPGMRAMLSPTAAILSSPIFAPVKRTPG